MRWLWMLLLLVPAPAAAQIEGRIALEGSVPASQVPRPSDPLCPLSMPPPMREGGPAAGAFVVLAEPPPGTHRALDPVVYRFADCNLKPAAAAILVGQQLVVKNESDVLHTVQLDAGEALVRSLPRKGRRFTHRFEKPIGLVRVHDAVHPGVQAHLLVLEHPYVAVTDKEGRFRLGGPPLAPGRYAVRVWHPRLGETLRWVDLKQSSAPVQWRVRPHGPTHDRRPDDRR